MDCARFLAQLPELYHDWGYPSIRPRSNRFTEVLGRVQGMTSLNVLQLLNSAVACLEDDEVYAEIGCFQGATLIGALLGNKDRLAYAADNFSEFDPQGQNSAILMNNLAAFYLGDQVRFHNSHFEEFLLHLRSVPAQFGVYLYDGAHDYRSQLVGLLLAVPHLAQRALIVVDDANMPAVKQATWDFLAARSEARLLLDLPTPANCHPTFWNGLYVLGWDTQDKIGYQWPVIQAARQPGLLGSLDALQRVNVRIRGDKVEVGRV